jgi:hypothetical protein
LDAGFVTVSGEDEAKGCPRCPWAAWLLDGIY